MPSTGRHVVAGLRVGKADRKPVEGLPHDRLLLHLIGEVQHVRLPGGAGPRRGCRIPAQLQCRSDAGHRGAGAAGDVTGIGDRREIGGHRDDVVFGGERSLRLMEVRRELQAALMTRPALARLPGHHVRCRIEPPRTRREYYPVQQNLAGRDLGIQTRDHRHAPDRKGSLPGARAASEDKGPRSAEQRCEGRNCRPGGGSGSSGRHPEPPWPIPNREPAPIFASVGAPKQWSQPKKSRPVHPTRMGVRPSLSRSRAPAAANRPEIRRPFSGMRRTRGLTWRFSTMRRAPEPNVTILCHHAVAESFARPPSPPFAKARIPAWLDRQLQG